MIARKNVIVGGLKDSPSTIFVELSEKGNYSVESLSDNLECTILGEKFFISANGDNISKIITDKNIVSVAGEKMNYDIAISYGNSPMYVLSGNDKGNINISSENQSTISIKSDNAEEMQIKLIADNEIKDSDVVLNGNDIAISEESGNLIIDTNTELNNYVFGDADGDNVITASDAAFVLQKTLVSTFELPIEKKTEDWLKYTDVDCDNFVTASDAAFILQKTLVSTFELPAETKNK